MKVRLITFHTPINYGAILQAYALQTYLKIIADDVKVIDFNTENLRQAYPLLKKGSSLKSTVAMLISVKNVPALKKKHKAFLQFVDQYLDLTRRYESVEELYESPPEGELFITGSDQVFNPNRAIDERQAFYLDFVPHHVRKAAYAGSFGTDKIPDDKREEIQGYLQTFDYLSIREKSGVSLVKELTGIEAIQVLDPVFLLDKEQWKTLTRPLVNLPERYILYYNLLKTPHGDEIANELSRRLQLPVVVITQQLFSSVHSHYILRDVGPIEFLSLYHHADFVLEDSFHGTAFSIIFEKPFVFCDEGATKGRAMDLLGRVHLENRAWPAKLDTLLTSPPDFEKVTCQLNELKLTSYSYLNNVVQNKEAGS